MSLRYYDPKGNPVDQMTWARQYADNRLRTRLELPHGTVSTVYLGLDHSLDGKPPLIFETMVFGGPYGGLQWRYATEAEAAAGHARVCEMVRTVSLWRRLKFRAKKAAGRWAEA